MRIAIEIDLLDACVDGEIEKVRIDGERRIFGEDVDRDFLHKWAQLTPRLEDRLEIFAVDYQMLFAIRQFALFPILLVRVAHNELLHAAK